MVHDKINKGILKFPQKKEAVVVNEDSFSLVVTISTLAAIDFKEFLVVEKAKEWTPNPNVKKA